MTRCQILEKCGPNYSLTPRALQARHTGGLNQGGGALGYYIVSDGTPRPYRVKISVGSFRNMLALPHLLVGAKLADMPAIYWALNYWPVEADR